MIQVEVKREYGITKLILKPEHRIDYQTYKKLVENRFYKPDMNKYWEYKGPDTDTAYEAAREIADRFED